MTIFNEFLNFLFFKRNVSGNEENEVNWQRLREREKERETVVFEREREDEGSVWKKNVVCVVERRKRNELKRKGERERE